jgi:predicted metalloprotease
MRWRRSPGDASGIEDRRRSGGARGGMIPGGRIGGGIGGLGIVGVIVVLLVTFLGGGGGSAFDVGPSLDPFQPAAPASEDALAEGPDPDSELRDFVAFVVNDVQTSWDEAFRRAGRDYEVTTLVLFTGGVNTACGGATSAAGPFYCPADRKVYLDLGFFRELQERFGAPGDFAQAYVIAHEFGHHVQNLLGIMDDVEAARREDPEDANELSVRLELQADCLAGVWAHSAYRDDLLEEGDLEEGLNAAAAVGDDRLQSQATGRVDPESFTHGTSEQRREWFLRGFDGGEVAACDTFA